MSLNDVVTLTLVTQSVFPVGAGFGIPLFMCVHSRTPNILESYSSEKGMLDDGFAVTDPAYKMAQKAFSQNPRPARVMIGKRALPYTKTVRLTPVITTTGYVYAFTVTGPNGVDTAISYTVPGAATVNSIATALAALVDAIADVTGTDGTGYVAVSSAAGTLFNISVLPPISALEVSDVTADPGITTDLTAVEAIDSLTWYGIALDSMSEAEVNAAATWTEARRKIQAFNTTDSGAAKNAVTTDIFSDLKAAAFARTVGLFSKNQLLSYSSVAWMSRMLSLPPGSATWAYQTLRGVTVDSLTDSEIMSLKNKSASWYVAVGGLNSVMQGRNGNTGAQEWIDVTVGVDWQHQDLQLTLFGLFKAASDAGQKIAFTDDGAETLVAGIKQSLARGIARSILAADPPPQVVAPKVADVAPADKAARHYSPITFSATLAGAIHSLEITGTLSV